MRGRLRIYSKCCRLKESVVDESDYWRDNGGEGVVEDAYWLSRVYMLGLVVVKSGKLLGAMSFQ